VDDRAAQQQTFLDGVVAIGTVASRFDGSDWQTAACGRWSALETARHVAAVAEWYHEWLDRAIDGVTTRPFHADEIDVMTNRSLEMFAGSDGPSTVAHFTARSAEYLDRVAERWDLPFAYPFGEVTAGLHLGVAAAEWHLHAWDLSSVSGPRHVPADPGALFMAAGRCVATAEGGAKGAVLRRLVPLGARHDPWQQMLRRSGRV
jgi:hypothetical protein